MLRKEPKPPTAPTASIEDVPRVEVKPGIFNRPLTGALLKRLGFEAYGTANCETMRLFEYEGGFSIEFWFPEGDPPIGRTAGLLRRFKTIPGNLYYMKAEIYNCYGESKYPRRIVQKVAIEGMTVDARDICQTPHQVWRHVEYPFTAISAQTEVAVFLEVVGELEPWHWGYSSRAILRNVELLPAWGE